MKKTILTGIIFCAMFLSGCTSAILSAYKEIQPCNFEIAPPAQGDFVMMLSDENLKENILGKWVCVSAAKSFCKIDLNNEPFMYKNMPDGKNTSVYEFKNDGVLIGEVITENINPQTNRVEVKNMKQSGTWTCKDGVFYISFLNEQNKKSYTVPAVAFWKTPETMELRFDTEAFENMVNDMISQEVKSPAGSSFDGYKVYYDKDGNFYNIIKNSSVNGSMTVKSEVIVKMPVQIYKREK